MLGKCLISNTENCKNCYKCIRNCYLKAISFENNRASIIHEDCVLCGTCYNICPHGLKVVRNDVDRVKELLKNNEVVVSLAPSFISYYEDSDIGCMKEALGRLGFKDVEETAIGATIVKKAYDAMLNEGRDVLISSCCHAINVLIQKHYPDCKQYLADVLSPMQAHGQNIKKRYGDSCKVVFIGPCIAKKDEGDKSEYIDAVLTFAELDDWLEKENIELPTISEPVKIEKSKARLFPTTGGILKTMECANEEYEYLTVDGIENAVLTLKDLQAGKIHKCFIEMSSCVGSCINGPLMSKKKRSNTARQLAIEKAAGKEDFEYSGSELKDIRTVYELRSIHKAEPAEEEIEKMLKKMGKQNVEERLNCGCCGYDTCRDKAIAIIRGYAKIEMCLPLLMEKSRSLANNIVANSPNGLMALDEELNIQLINRTLCRMVGIPDPKTIIGQHVATIFDPSDYFDVLEGKTINSKNEYLSEYEKYIEKTIAYDQKYKTVICIIRDITTEVENRHHHKEMVEKTIAITDSLLEKNLRSVHEIASLLGETSAETKVALETLKGLVDPDE